MTAKLGFALTAALRSNELVGWVERSETHHRLRHERSDALIPDYVGAEAKGICLSQNGASPAMVIRCMRRRLPGYSLSARCWVQRWSQIASKRTSQRNRRGNPR